ncbi:MAG: cation:proton antiporter subunit C [Ilumatobacter sp.]|uniref:cation:proton antiporter subunit C n=1 Tax=Ilumatobacter sp. TaxID=1967498 RepID=UPI00260F6394|nr:cation:proton antiporter subunit C [Ilumatobacter sp.]MDJ0769779.1 cation:proton antiporter subunit C [Ilumatobacter sp.]
MAEFWDGGYAYYATALLLVIGLYAILVKRNLVKKLIGLNIMQAAIILTWVASATRPDATVPVLDTHGEHGEHGEQVVDPAEYLNPLPHTLMLTAIVVGVATTGVAFALLISIYRRYGTLDEAELLEQMRGEPG